MNICEKCGLPNDLCVCESIAKERQKIIISLEKKKFGKNYTILSGIDPKEIDIEQVAKKLKSKFACGGTVKANKIELQGDHKLKAKEFMIELGFAPETIVVQ